MAIIWVDGNVKITLLAAFTYKVLVGNIIENRTLRVESKSNVWFDVMRVHGPEPAVQAVFRHHFTH